MPLKPYSLAANGVYSAADGAYAPAVAVVDDWETGDLAAWSDTGSGCTVQSSTVQQGSYALELASGHSSMASHPGDGLDNYPSAGDTWNIWFNTTAGGRKYIRFFYDGSSGWYGLLLEATDDIQLRKDGGSTTLGTLNLNSANDGNWHRINVDWATNGDYTITAYDASGTEHGSITGNDTDYTSGGIDFLDVDTTGPHYFDNWYLGDTGSSDDGGDGGDGGDGSVTAIATFESQSLSAWGNTANWSITSTNPAQGSYALQTGSGSGHDHQIYSEPGDGLDNYPSAGDTWSFWFRPENVGDSSWTDVLFAYSHSDISGNDTWYRIYMRNDDFANRISVRDSDTNTITGNADIPWSNGSWFKIIVDWTTGGDITVTVEDASGSTLGSVSGNDTTWSSGGVAIRPFDQSGDTFDHFIIEN